MENREEERMAEMMDGWWLRGNTVAQEQNAGDLEYGSGRQMASSAHS
jgi:hypothetical protein